MCQRWTGGGAHPVGTRLFFFLPQRCRRRPVRPARAVPCRTSVFFAVVVPCCRVVACVVSLSPKVEGHTAAESRLFSLSSLKLALEGLLLGSYGMRAWVLPVAVRASTTSIINDKPQSQKCVNQTFQSSNSAAVRITAPVARRALKCLLSYQSRLHVCVRMSNKYIITS